MLPKQARWRWLLLHPSPPSPSPQPSISTITMASCFSPSPAGYWRNFMTFWFLGVINNLAYVVVNSAAKSLADGFGQSSMIGLILWCNIAFGIVARFGNTFLLEVYFIASSIVSHLSLNPFHYPFDYSSIIFSIFSYFSSPSSRQ